MFVFRKVWRALFPCYLRFEIYPFALLPTIRFAFFFIGNVKRSMAMRRKSWHGRRSTEPFQIRYSAEFLIYFTIFCLYFLMVFYIWHFHIFKVWSMDQMTFVMWCAIWYHLHNLKNVKNTYGGVLILVKLQASDVFYSS